MRQFEIDKENYIIEKNLTIDRLELDNIIAFEYYKNDMIFLIDSFNKEYNWDDMFDVNQVKSRIENGHILFILYYDKNPIGYIWYRIVTKKICKAYNLYVTKVVDRPTDAAYWFYKKTTETMLNEYDKIICEAEDWNVKAHDIFFKSGFRQI